jgi:methyl-accepting chemotaxis protein
MVKMLSSGLPLLTETLGQARGMGTGIATQGNCNVSCRIKMKFLQKRMLEVLETTMDTLPHGLREIGQIFNASKEATHTFAQNVKEEMIEARAIQITADEFYRQGTEAIESNFRLFDALLPILEESIHHPA